jgi:hypothetical protein
MEFVGARILDVGISLRDETQETVSGERVLERRERTRTSDEQRKHGRREDDELPKRKQRELVGQIERRGGGFHRSPFRPRRRRA